MSATATARLPLWTVVRSTHSTFDCEACDSASQAAAHRLASGALRATLTEERDDGKHRATVERVERELNIAADSPLQPEDLTDAERDRLQRARPESVVMLEQMPDGQFNIHGNAAVMCGECGSTFIGQAGTISTLKQRHLSIAHDVSAPLLPPRRDSVTAA